MNMDEHISRKELQSLIKVIEIKQQNEARQRRFNIIAEAGISPGCWVSGGRYPYSFYQVKAISSSGHLVLLKKAGAFHPGGWKVQLPT